MLFGIFRVHPGGDFKEGIDSEYANGVFTMKVDGKFLREKINISEVQELTPVTIKKPSKIGTSLALGGIIGPEAAALPYLVDLQKGNASFICRFKDGRIFLATVSEKLYKSIETAVLRLRNIENQEALPSSITAESIPEEILMQLEGWQPKKQPNEHIFLKDEPQNQIQQETSPEKKNFCSNCGNPIVENSNFCSNCGQKL